MSAPDPLDCGTALALVNPFGVGAARLDKRERGAVWRVGRGGSAGSRKGPAPFAPLPFKA
jgi:hypothetical protein